MSRYRIDYTPRAIKQLRAIRDARTGNPIKQAIQRLAIDPRHTGVTKLVDADDEWRVRVGDWRIVYRIDDGVLVVLVVKVAPRGGVYR